MQNKTVKIAVIAAVVIVLLILGVSLAMPMIKYNSALSLMEEGRYEDAVAAFELMDGYKDSEAKIEECRLAILDNDYNAALALMADGNYSEAISVFRSLDYKDSEAKIAECELAITEEQYNEALSLMAAGNYMDAGKIFKSIDFSDSAEKYEECRATAPYDFTEIGDIITFGKYEQDYNLDNGKEPIDWRVLDKEDGKVLVISDKALEMLPYFAIYWKRSHIGGWLNGPFLYDFTPEEKAMIVETTVTADKHPDKPETDQGANTEHGMYLLSVDEVFEYMPNEEDRVCYATEYLKAQFTDTIHLDGLEENGTCDWWLRTALSNYSSGASIAIIGGGGTLGWATHNCRLALRPVCWIQLEG